MTIDRKDDDGDGDDDQVDDLPTEESLLVKLSRRADIALVKGLLVITNLKNTYIYDNELWNKYGDNEPVDLDNLVIMAMTMMMMAKTTTMRMEMIPGQRPARPFRCLKQVVHLQTPWIYICIYLCSCILVVHLYCHRKAIILSTWCTLFMTTTLISDLVQRL